MYIKIWAELWGTTASVPLQFGMSLPMQFQCDFPTNRFTSIKNECQTDIQFGTHFLFALLMVVLNKYYLRKWVKLVSRQHIGKIVNKQGFVSAYTVALIHTT